MDHIVPTLLIALFIWGCAQQDAEPEAQAQQQQQESSEEIPAIDVPEADSVEVINDERNLERRIDDASIAARVRIALVDADDLRQFNFDPVVVNGQVQLRGEVNTRDQRNRAEAIATEVNGVRGVTNEVTALEQPVPAEETSDTAEQDGSADSGVAAADDDSARESEESSAEDASEQQASESEQTASAQQESETYHTVSSGESLWTISRSYGVSIDQIRRLNNLSSNSLRPGQRLRVR